MNNSHLIILKNIGSRCFRGAKISAYSLWNFTLIGTYVVLVRRCFDSSFEVGLAVFLLSLPVACYFGSFLLIGEYAKAGQPKVSGEPKGTGHLDSSVD